MNNHDFKLKLFNDLLNRNIWTKKVSNIQIRTRCPWCGDSTKNSQTGHLYIRINPNDNLPIVYNCFKCPAKGILKKDDLELLEIYDNEISDDYDNFMKTTDRVTVENSTVEQKFFNYKIPDNFDKRKISYLENRLCTHFSNEELNKIKVITSFIDFLNLNQITSITCNDWLFKDLERDYIGFLSNNNAFILFRDITNRHDFRWFKYRVSKESEGQRSFYSIKTDIELYSKEDIIVNISEGVMDAISIYHFMYPNDNSLNIAIGGKYYVNMIKYLIEMGFIGYNIIFNIYVDNDHSADTSLKYLKKELAKYTYFVKEINLCYNTLNKDCGVSKDKILLNTYKI